MTHQKAKKHNFLLPFILLEVLLFTLFMPSGHAQNEADTSSTENEELKVTTVVIDPGHGGKDPGAIGHTKVQEKDVVLDVSLKLGEYIKENFKNVNVIYTRKTDKFVELYERARIANNNNADLFISVHANVAGSKAAHGCETYVLGLHRTQANLEVAKKENSAILMEENYKSHYENFDPHSPESYIALELMQSEYLEQSLEYAALAQDQFKERVGRRNRGVKQAGFLVLYRTTMPSVLVELGFLSNPKEEKFLSSDKGQSYMASALFRAFREYKKKIDKVNKETYSSSLADSIQKKKEQRVKENNKGDPVASSNSPPPNKEDIRFKVQIAASTESIPLKPKNFKGLSNVDEYISDGIYKYTVGNKRSYEKAKNLREKVRDSGYSGAFIIAFHKGERMDLQEALSLAGQNSQ